MIGRKNPPRPGARGATAPRVCAVPGGALPPGSESRRLDRHLSALWRVPVEHLVRASIAILGATLGTAYLLYVVGPHRRTFAPFISELDFEGWSRLPFTAGVCAESVLLFLIARRVALARAPHAASPWLRRLNELAEVVLNGASLGLFLVGVVSAPVSPLWHAVGAVIAFRGVLVWIGLQLALSAAMPPRSRRARAALAARLAVFALGFVLVRATIGLAAQGQALVHAGDDWMAFFEVVPRPPAFQHAALAEWALALVCFAGLLTLPAEVADLESRGGARQDPDVL